MLVKDIAVSPAIFNIKDSDNDYIYKSIKLELLFKFYYKPNYKYWFWQYAHMHQFMQIYYNAIRVADRIQLQFNTVTAAKMDGLGIADSWAQTAKDNTVNKNNNKEEEDFNGINNIVCIGQFIIKDLENLIKLSKLINNAKY